MVNGNLAYKNEYYTRSVRPVTAKPMRSSVRSSQRHGTVKHGARVYDHRGQTVNKHVQAVSAVKTFEKEKREMVHRKVTLLRIVYMSVIALSASFMISKYVAVNDTASEIKKLTNQLESTRAYTSQRVYEMERNIDLSEVEEIATTELGMQRPESYQIVYVNVDKDDVSEVTARDVEGAGNDIKAFFENVKKNIVELFCIN